MKNSICCQESRTAYFVIYLIIRFHRCKLTHIKFPHQRSIFLKLSLGCSLGRVIHGGKEVGFPFFDLDSNLRCIYLSEEPFGLSSSWTLGKE